MDLSALESVSKALEKSLDFWGFLLLVSTAVVVFGLVVEYWHDVKEFWVIVRWPMSEFPWDKFKTLVGGILVTLGVAGELFFTARASRIETDLRNNSHRIEAFLTEKAAEAEQKASDANQKAESERLERVKLEAQLLPRRLSSKQIDELTSKLKGIEIAGQNVKPISITTAALDAESADFARDFEASFKAAGWTTVIMGWDQTGERGLDIGMLEDPSEPGKIPSIRMQLVQSIHDTIINIGVPCRIFPLHSTDAISLHTPEKNVLYLLVRRKPEVVFAPNNGDKNKKSKAKTSSLSP